MKQPENPHRLFPYIAVIAGKISLFVGAHRSQQQFNNRSDRNHIIYACAMCTPCTVKKGNGWQTTRTEKLRERSTHTQRWIKKPPETIRNAQVFSWSIRKVVVCVLSSPKPKWQLLERFSRKTGRRKPIHLDSFRKKKNSCARSN